MKENRSLTALTSALILLPLPVGLLLWSRLPDVIPTHFGLNGEPNGFTGKPFTVLGIPLILLAIHLLCLFTVTRDPRVQDAGKGMRRLALWICPAVTLFCFCTIYPNALGMALDIPFLSMLFMGLLFTGAGNYLPKCRQNGVIGIRTPWTLLDEEVWNRTHRLAGPLWVVSGLVILAEAFVRIAVPVVTGLALAACVLVPIACSAYWYYGKRDGNGGETARE